MRSEEVGHLDICGQNFGDRIHDAEFTKQKKRGDGKHMHNLHNKEIVYTRMRRKGGRRE